MVDVLSQRMAGWAALSWLGDRVTGWGRVHVVTALCRYTPTTSREWLLRHACDGRHLDRYVAGKVAIEANLHEAITADAVDDGLVDHTTRVLGAMTHCVSQGPALDGYPSARHVLDAHVRHLAEQEPAPSRYIAAGVLAVGLGPGEDRDRYLEVLDRDDWCAVAGDMDGDHWFVEVVAARLPLRAFEGRSPAGS